MFTQILFFIKLCDVTGALSQEFVPTEIRCEASTVTAIGLANDAYYNFYFCFFGFWTITCSTGNKITYMKYNYITDLVQGINFINPRMNS